MSRICQIYYFSGTGNAEHAARWVGERGREMGLDADTINIASLENRKDIPLPSEDEIIGFSGPTHGFNYPPILFHFLIRFPRSKHGNRVFLMNTRAGTRLGPFFLPGLSGMAQYLSALILGIKGYRIVGMKPVDLPSNWISLHPGLSKTTVEAMFELREPQVQEFARNIFSGKREYRALLDIIQDLLITPIGILYYLVGRFLLAKSFYASRDCNLCRVCIRQCPVQAIIEVDKRPFWTWKCENCMRCMNRCPERAIETGHGYIFAIIYACYALIIYRIYDRVNVKEVVKGYAGEIASGLVGITLETIIFIPFLFLGYWLLHYLRRIPVIERLVVFTSLTKLPFWNRYRPPKGK
jgi:ferredoxin